MSTEIKEENINSLCKKYFTPELCDELITENKTALKGKIYAHLIKLGDWICDKDFSKQGGSGSLCDKVFEVIEKCWEIWERKTIERNYKSYFYASIKNEVVRFINSKNENLNTNAMRLDEQIGDDEKMSVYEIIESKNYSIKDENERKDQLEKVENYLKTVNLWFKIRKRENWNKSLVTAELYSGLHKYFDYYPHKSISKFNFIDERIFYLPKEPLNKELADILGKDEGQVSKAKKTFRKQIEELLKKDW